VHFSEQIEVPVAAGDVWSFVWQVERMAACLPGCVGVAEVEADRRYMARIEDHVGPYGVGFDLDVVIEEVDPPNRIRLSATGSDKRLGAQRIAMIVEIHQLGPMQTRLDVEADLEVLGKVAALGQFVIKRKARDVVKQFAQNLETALRPAPPPLAVGPMLGDPPVAAAGPG
jgi:carbon monoxide dehydrogenase subunit G